MAFNLSLAEHQLTHRELCNIIVEQKGLFHAAMRFCPFGILPGFQPQPVPSPRRESLPCVPAAQKVDRRGCGSLPGFSDLLKACAPPGMDGWRRPQHWYPERW